MIPNFGDIWTRYLKGVTTPAEANVSTQLTLTEFWTTLVNENTLAKFLFTGTSVVGTAVIPIVGRVGSISSQTTATLSIPSTKQIKLAMAMQPNVWLGFFSLLAHTIETSGWFIDCKAASYATPFPAKLVCATWPAYAETFNLRMKGIAPTSQKEAMNIVSEGVKEFLQSVINVCPYTGTGAGVLTGTMTVQFSI